MNIRQNLNHTAFYVTLKTESGPTTKKVEGGLYTVGRGTECHLSIRKEGISRRHLSISLKDDQFWIEDLGSANGTFINGKRIPAHSKTSIQPADKVVLGIGEVELAVSREPPSTKVEAVTIALDTSNDDSHHAIEWGSDSAPPVESARDQNPEILQEAKKNAAIILQDAQIEAQRATEDIYRRAHETEAKADEFYQARMNEAFKASEEVYQKSQTESQSMLEDARRKAAEAHKEAEAFVITLRQRTKEECERLLEDTQKTARGLKADRIAEAEAHIKQKQDEILAHARDLMNEEKVRLERELQLEAERRKQDLKKEIDERRTELEAEHNDLIEKLTELRTEIEAVSNLKANKQSLVTEIESSIKRLTSQSAGLQDELVEKRTALGELNLKSKEIKKEIDQLERDRLQLQLKAKDSQEELENLSKTIDEKRTQGTKEHQEQLDSINIIKKQIQDLENQRVTSEASLKKVEGVLDKKNQEAQQLIEMIEEKQKYVKEMNDSTSTLKIEAAEAVKLRTQTELKLTEARDNLTRLTEQIRISEDRVKAGHAAVETQLVQLRTRMEDNKAKFQKEESERLVELKLKTSRKLREMELRMVEELAEKRTQIVREISLVVETFLRENSDAKRNLRQLNERIDRTVESHISTISKDGKSKATQISLSSIKWRQRVVSGVAGAVLSLTLLQSVKYMKRRLGDDLSPMERKVANAQEARKRDLERRKFNPPLTRDFKGSYVDNVVYTNDFVTTYTSDAFQTQFRRALSPYMFRTWKLEEEKVIELLGMTQALVTELHEKRISINPDFVPQGLSRMRELEVAVETRLRTLLGSNVRVESFRKFEKDFFEKYTLQK